MAPHAGTVVLEPATKTARTRTNRAKRGPGAARDQRTARSDPLSGVILEALPTLPLVCASEHTHADPASLHEPTAEEIRQRAYEIYLARGCEPGHDVDDWLRAERELRARART